MPITINHIRSTDYYSVWEARVDALNAFRFTTQLRTLLNVREFKELRAGSEDFGDVTLIFKNEEVKARLGSWYLNTTLLSEKLTWYKLGESGICDLDLASLRVAIVAEKKLMEVIELYKRIMDSVSEEKRMNYISEEKRNYEDDEEDECWKEIKGCPVRFPSGDLG